MYVNNLFMGTCDNVSARDKFGQVVQVDRQKNSLDERLSEVNEVLENDDFFEDYFDEIYNPHITDSSALSEDNNVCQMLSSMADYLLMSDESKAISRSEKTVYVYSDEVMNEKIVRESLNDGADIEVLATRPKDNDYVLPKQKITHTDLTENSYLGSVLRDYQKMLDIIDDKMSVVGEGYRKLSNHKHDVKDNMILSKNILKGVWGENCNPIYPQPEKEYNFFDFSDKSTVNYLLTMRCEFKRNKSLWLTATDFEDFVKTCNLKKYEIELFQLLKLGYSSVNIEEITGVDERVIRMMKHRLVDKIVGFQFQYDAEEERFAKNIKLKKLEQLKEIE